MSLERAQQLKFDDLHGMNVIGLLQLLCTGIIPLDEIAKSADNYTKLRTITDNEEVRAQALFLELFYLLADQQKELLSSVEGRMQFRNLMFQNLRLHFEREDL